MQGDSVKVDESVDLVPSTNKQSAREKQEMDNGGGKPRAGQDGVASEESNNNTPLMEPELTYLIQAMQQDPAFAKQNISRILMSWDGTMRRRVLACYEAEFKARASADKQMYLQNLVHQIKNKKQQETHLDPSAPPIREVETKGPPTLSAQWQTFRRDDKP